LTTDRRQVAATLYDLERVISERKAMFTARHRTLWRQRPNISFNFGKRGETHFARSSEREDQETKRQRSRSIMSEKACYSMFSYGQRTDKPTS